MFTNYSFDRDFTDYIHYNLAKQIIYQPLNWRQKDADIEKLKQDDIYIEG